MKKRLRGMLLSVLMCAMFMSSVLEVQAAQILYDNEIGIQDEYNYELWKDYGTTSMTLNSGGTFCCQWNDIGNALFRKGKKFEPSETYQQIGNISIDFGCNYQPDGNSYLCAYGWCVDPLVEYYIVESWGTWRPPGAEAKGTITVDGGTYDVYETTRVDKPSIQGVVTFKQYWSVRAERRTSGIISVTEHFKAWERMGMQMGKLYETALNIEGYQSSGWADVYQNTIRISDYDENMKKYEEDIQMYTNGIIILKDKIIYKNELLSQLQIYNYKEITDIYGITEFNKQQINNFINQVNEISLYTSFFIVMFIYLYIIYVCTTFVDIMMLGVLGFIVARIIGIKMRFKASFNIGVYALTLPIILNLIYIIINSFTNFTIQNFQWMYRTISYIYVIVAILMIKTDFINQQIELQKILEEQERVKKQMKEEKEENKKEEKKENDDPKDENTDQDDKPKENPLQKKNRDNNLGNDGLAPQGIKDLPNNQ